ncbi:MAG: hypothetical protein ACP5KN_08375 [Armatimonadota bacterium]
MRVPRRFYVCIDFDATYTRGVYVFQNHDVERSHSFFALPYSGIMNVKGQFDWMIRAHLSEAPAEAAPSDDDGEAAAGEQ